MPQVPTGHHPPFPRPLAFGFRELLGLALPSLYVTGLLLESQRSTSPHHMLES